eukprot:COSAG05_NODE_1488_length_4726_cov_9.016641_1_plen_255_part_00
MSNALPPTSPCGRYSKVCAFDLKGSTRGRRATPSPAAPPPARVTNGGWMEGWAATERLTLKDLDWREAMATPLLLSRAEYGRVMGSLRSDVSMLEGLNVVDFSLLLGLYVVEIDHSRLLPVPPSELPDAHAKGGGDARQHPSATGVRVSADAAALTATYRAHRARQADGQVAATDARNDASDDASRDDDVGGRAGEPGEAAAAQSESANSHLRWVRASAVVRRHNEERVVQLRVSCAIVDVLSPISSPSVSLSD